MKKNRVAWTFLLLLTLVIGTAFIPTGYDVLFADEPLVLNDLVQYEAGNELDGEIGMTYVAYLEDVNWPFLLLAVLFEEGVEIESSTSETLDMELEDLHIQYDIMMEQSKIKAEYIAREYQNENPDLTLTGFYPVHYIPDWQDKNLIEVSDIILEIDGEKLDSYDHMNQLVMEKEPDTEVVLTVIRDGEQQEVTVRTYPERDYYGNTMLGVYLEEVYKLIEDERIQFNIEEVGGPSAGLMLTLTLIEKMTEESLLKGNNVAGTGTIEMNGIVGPIGGVKQKVIGAELAGYDYFIVPKDNEYGNNEEIARRTIEEEGLSIQLLPVQTLEEAIIALKKLPAKD
ncbi:S16 family serine protease [Sutcliffiella deserti]|uniref:S16 family serine protease n=1 Tax=Sutcliffiella deserti TaxID=2875501 RepID=UPI001CBBA674|nr:S16 family serine protease [Sutcliffiella deserti]